MPRRPKHQVITCQYFVWRLFTRDGVYYADGRGSKHDLRKHSLGTRDPDEALERLKQLDQHEAVRLGLAAPRTNSTLSPISIPDGWDRYMEHSGRSLVLGGVSAGTLKRYRAVRDKHLEFCRQHGIASWSDFDTRSLERYGNWLSKDYADRTVYLELTLLKSVNDWLVKHKLLPADCTLVYPLRKPQGSDTYCYSRREVSAMVAWCQASARLAWLAAVIIALAHTGLRISELAGLRWSDVDLEHDVIRVADERASRRRREAGTARTTKGRRSRILPLHPRLKSLLMTLERQADGRVFHAPLGGRLWPRNVLDAFINEVIEPLKQRFSTPAGEIGFEHGRLHSFRHFFCSQAFLDGASEGEIREWLGHRESRMVEHYRHLRSDDAQRKMERIDFLDRQDERLGGVA
jgi:integrase